jgi:hypothetical protein
MWFRDWVRSRAEMFIASQDRSSPRIILQLRHSWSRPGGCARSRRLTEENWLRLSRCKRSRFALKLMMVMSLRREENGLRSRAFTQIGESSGAPVPPDYTAVLPILTKAGL